jgi:hypothetical protein
MDMKTKTGLGAAFALTLVGSLAAQSAMACTAPATPKSLPDGRTASLEAMQYARFAVEQYVERVGQYFRCENDAVKLQDAGEREKAVLDRFNSSVLAYLRANSIATARPAGYTPR